ncbi:hypothetical protein DL96DRAFT_1716400 [Flagelloscypha sp. PMI_526]|nr:hypothetical protein DL96DRAFT_1716400 [Flagelloscypha sp. PMI_526]
MLTSPLASNLPPELQNRIIQLAARESSLSECIGLMLICKMFYKDVCDVAYHTIVLDGMRMCRGFAALIDSKPATFFASRTRALYVPLPSGLDAGLIPDALWSLAWETIISKLSSLHYLDVNGSIESLSSLTLNRPSIFFLVHLVHQDNAPVFRCLTHLKLFTAEQIVENTNFLLQSKTFPSVSHLMLLTDQSLAQRLAENFATLKVLILAIFKKPTVKDISTQRRVVRFPNVFVVSWDHDESQLSTPLGRLEAFRSEADGKSISLWNQAEREIVSSWG